MDKLSILKVGTSQFEIADAEARETLLTKADASIIINTPAIEHISFDIYTFTLEKPRDIIFFIVPSDISKQ